MNKVFKVIWSEARNAYVVVSEIAKNHGSKSCSTKKLLAMLIATGVMTCASVAPAMAANPAPNDTKIEVGKGASAVKDSVAIGSGASVVAGNNGSSGVALGNKAHAGYKGTSLGSSAISGREGTTLVGANTHSASLYTTVVGTDSVINSDGTTYKVSFMGIKKELNVQGAAATVVGSKNTVDNRNGKVYSGVANNVMGSANTIEGSNGVTIQGIGNKVTDAYKDMNIGIWEAYNIGKGDYSALAKKESGAVAVVGGANTVSKQTDSTVIGYDNQLIGDKEKTSHDVFMAGSHNKLNNVSDSIVMGNKNAITGVSNVISFCHENSISANNAVAIGSGAGVSAEGGVALGVGSVADRANAVSVGSTGAERQIINVAKGTEDTDAVNVSQLKDVKAEALKHSTVTNGDNNITVTEGFNKDGGKEYNVALKNDIYLEGDDPNAFVSISGSKGTIWTSGKVTAGSVEAGSVVMDGATATVSGLGNTTTAYDGFATTGKAATEEQLKEIAKVADNANQGWNLSTNGGEASKVAPGETVDISGDKNIKISNDGANVKVKLNDNIDVNSVQTNALNAKYNLSVGTANENGTVPFFVNSNGAFYAANGKLVVDKDGKLVAPEAELSKVTADEGVIGNVVLFYKHTALRDGELFVGDADGNYSQITTKGAKLGQVVIAEDGKISNVAAGVADTDAVNVGQLKEAVEAGNTDTHIKPGEYGVGADNTVNMDVVDKNGNKVDTVTIKDVAKASDVGDVNNIASDIKNQDGSHTTVVDAVNNLNNKVGDLQYSKVEKGEIADGDSTTTAIGKLDQKLTDVAATAAKHTKVEGSSNITVTNTAKEGEAANYKVELKRDIDVDTVTANTVTTGQTVMNNDGLKVGTDVSVTATAVTAGQTSINNEGLAVGPNTSLKADELKVDGKTYIDKNGLNANGMKITNVADGKENSDAVNVGQLKESEKTINNRIDGVENQVVNNTNRINKLGSRVNKVGAGAAALAALHPMDFDPDDKLTFSAGYGNYAGENAAAIGAYYRPDEKVMFSVAGTVGNGENMVNAGVSFALDRTNHVSNSRTALAREVIDLRGQLAVMGAKMAKMEKAFGMLDETKTKLFPDVPANHWAYEYIAKLAGNGYIEGYPDGNFGGDRLMTRYEFAAMLYRAIENGAALEEKIIKEFEPELGRIRVDRISGEDGDRDKIERVRVNDTKGERDHYGNKLAK